jgi:hypothetical protein
MSLLLALQTLAALNSNGAATLAPVPQATSAAQVASAGAATLSLIPGGSSVVAVASTQSSPVQLTLVAVAASTVGIASIDTTPIAFVDSGGSELVTPSSIATSTAKVASDGSGALLLSGVADSTHDVAQVADTRPGGAGGNPRRVWGRKPGLGFVNAPGIEITPLILPRRSHSSTHVAIAGESRSISEIRSRGGHVLPFVTSGSTSLGPIPDDELAIALLMAVA